MWSIPVSRNRTRGLIIERFTCFVIDLPRFVSHGVGVVVAMTYLWFRIVACLNETLLAGERARLIIVLKRYSVVSRFDGRDNFSSEAIALFVKPTMSNVSCTLSTMMSQTAHDAYFSQTADLGHWHGGIVDLILANWHRSSRWSLNLHDSQPIPIAYFY